MSKIHTLHILVYSLFATIFSAPMLWGQDIIKANISNNATLYINKSILLTKTEKAQLFKGALVEGDKITMVAVKKPNGFSNQHTRGESIYLSHVLPVNGNHPYIANAMDITKPNLFVSLPATDTPLNVHNLLSSQEPLNIYNTPKKFLNFSSRPLFVAKLMQGDLFGYLHKKKLTPTEKYRLAIKIFAQISSALEAVHSSGHVHLDVKPKNIFLNSNEHFVLGDFDLLEPTDHNKFVMSGTRGYYKDSSAHPFRDYYSLSMVVLEILLPSFTHPKDLAYEGKINEITNLYYKHVVQPIARTDAKMTKEVRLFFSSLLKGLILNNIELQKQFFKARSNTDTGNFNSIKQSFLDMTNYRAPRICHYLFN